MTTMGYFAHCKTFASRATNNKDAAKREFAGIGNSKTNLPTYYIDEPSKRHEPRIR